MHTPLNQCTSDCRRDGCPDDIMEFLADDQIKHAELPADAEMDAMYDATVESESKEYQNAH